MKDGKKEILKTNLYLKIIGFLSGSSTYNHLFHLLNSENSMSKNTTIGEWRLMNKTIRSYQEDPDPEALFCLSKSTFLGSW